MKTLVLLTVLLVSILLFSLLTSAQTALQVVVVGVDGLGGEALRKIPTTTFASLIKTGAYTLHARAVLPTVSSPNWASMIMGAGPEQHGVTSNDWKPDKFEIAPVSTGTGRIFPTIFSVVKQQRPEATIGIFHDWDEFGRLTERNIGSVIEDADGPADAIRRSLSFIRATTPALTFIHLDHVDHAGHEHGWFSPEYESAIKEADRLLKELIDGIKASGSWDRTVLLLTADHGGVGTKHGGMSTAEIEIPWILHGPGVVKGVELKTPINTYDTAPTLAHIMGVRPHEAWIGKPVREALTR